VIGQESQILPAFIVTYSIEICQKQIQLVLMEQRQLAQSTKGERLMVNANALSLNDNSAHAAGDLVEQKHFSVIVDDASQEPRASRFFDQGKGTKYERV
jgi:hypothetical protein